MACFQGDVTIVLPTKNEEKNLPRLLATLPADIPLIVLNDSTDHTRMILKSLRPRNTRLVPMAGGVSAKRQRGAELAQSEWVLFTDADIEFTPDYFQKLKNCLKGDLVYGPKLCAGKRHLYYNIFYMG